MSGVGVVEEWASITRWLDSHAPVTAALLIPGSGDDGAVELAASMRTDFPGDLRDWWLACGGTERAAFAEVIPPFYTPYGAAAALRSWRAWMDNEDSSPLDEVAGKAAP